MQEKKIQYTIERNKQMSFHTFAVYGTGLVLTDTDVTDFLNSDRIQRLADTPIAKPYHITESPENFTEFFNETFDTDICHYYDESADSKTFINIHNDGQEVENQMLIFNLKKTPTLFATAYHDIDEIIAELKEAQIINFLPENFDFPSHIGYFNCVTFS